MTLGDVRALMGPFGRGLFHKHVVPVEQRSFAFDGSKQVELFYVVSRFLSFISEYQALPGGGFQAVSRW